MFSEELVDKAYVIDLTLCERQVIQNLRVGAVLGEAAEWATGFGEAKLAYDAASYGLGLAICAAQKP
jgi:hypothetical protein